MFESGILSNRDLSSCLDLIEFYTQVMESQMANTSSGQMADTHDAQLASSAAKEMLKDMARKDPQYKRNRPHICSFFLKGNCTRGNECPFRSVAVKARFIRSRDDETDGW